MKRKKIRKEKIAEFSLLNQLTIRFEIIQGLFHMTLLEDSSA